MPDPSPAPVNHVWYYLKETFTGEHDEGPFTEPQLIELAKSGKIKPKTKLKSPTRTKGHLVYAESVKGVMNAITQGLEAAAAEKARLAAEKKLATAQAAAAAPTPAASSSTLENIKEKVAGILTSGESIVFCVAQAKPIAIKADAAVCTNRRLIIFRPKLLGRFDFEDFLWHELRDAHLKQGVVGSTFTAQHISGKVISIDWLPKDGAQQIYRYSQEREEAALMQRRQMQMEEQAAGATKINIAQMPGAAPAIGPAAVDPMAKLRSLKEMLDAGLISQSEFDQKKAEILQSM